ncbi:MAG TPA: hypothetical protein IAA41_00120 [Candidatus Eubacterium faecavium]|nr:hypothetical protein [Candidatus Eubacterium faecavium]
MIYDGNAEFGEINTFSGEKEYARKISETGKALGGFSMEFRFSLPL